MARNEKHYTLLAHLLQKDKQEHQATATIASEILTRLNISINILPHKCQQSLKHAASSQAIMELDHLDPISISLQNSFKKSQQVQREYELLKLKQKNIELQTKIDRNQKFLESLREELDSSQMSLTCQSPNPDNIQDHIRQLKQKLTSYEETYKKTQVYFSKLSVPDNVLPQALQAQLLTLNELNDVATEWQQRADEVLLMRNARQQLKKCTLRY